MRWSLADLLTLAKLSEAAYLLNSRSAVEALGMSYVGQVSYVDAMLTLAKWGEHDIVAWAGTHFATNTNVAEIMDNLDGTLIPVGPGHVARGYWEPVESLWPKVENAFPQGPTLVVGHSEGGSRAHLSKAKAPSAEIVSFGACCAATAPFWAWAFGADSPCRVVHADDFAPDWSPQAFEGFCQPLGDMLWLHGGRAEEVARRDVLVSVLDPACVNAHWIASGYEAAVEAAIRAG